MQICSRKRMDVSFFKLEFLFDFCISTITKFKYFTDKFHYFLQIFIRYNVRKFVFNCSNLNDFANTSNITLLDQNENKQKQQIFSLYQW